MKAKLKKILALGFIVICLSLIASKTASAQCGCVCAAICDRICMVSCDGCSDSQAGSKAIQCCNGAWSNTPGLGPCTSVQLEMPEW